jgi:hypothetical protein
MRCRAHSLLAMSRTPTSVHSIVATASSGHSGQSPSDIGVTRNAVEVPPFSGEVLKAGDESSIVVRRGESLLDQCAEIKGSCVTVPRRSIRRIDKHPRLRATVESIEKRRIGEAPSSRRRGPSTLVANQRTRGSSAGSSVIRGECLAGFSRTSAGRTIADLSEPARISQVASTVFSATACVSANLGAASRPWLAAACARREKDSG